MLRYITPDGQVGSMRSIKLSSPFCVKVDRDTGHLYVSDLKEHCIFKIIRARCSDEDPFGLNCTIAERITPYREDEYFKIYAGIGLARFEQKTIISLFYESKPSLFDHM